MVVVAHFPNLNTCLPPLAHSPIFMPVCPPSPTPHFEHLPNFHVCAPPFGHEPDSDSIALAALALYVVASPGARLRMPLESGMRHLGHSSCRRCRCGAVVSEGWEVSAHYSTV